MKDLYIEHCKIMKKIVGDRNKLKDTFCLWIERIGTHKISIQPKVIFRFIAILIKIPMPFFIEIESYLKQNIQMNKAIRNKKDKSSGILHYLISKFIQSYSD
jgi:hypothetical protein